MTTGIPCRRHPRWISGNARDLILSQKGINFVCEPGLVSRFQNRVAIEALAELNEEFSYDGTIKSKTGRQLDQDRAAFFPETSRLIEKLLEACFRPYQPLLMGDDLR